MASSAPNSAVDICNLALIELKQAPIVQLDPATSMAEQVMALSYHQKRRSVLRKHPWNFAIKRIAVTPSSSNVPEFGYSHGYLLPVDFIRLVGVYDSEGLRIEPTEYEIEDGKILYDGEDNTELNIRYVYDHKIVSKFDSLFIDMFVIELAIAVAPRFSGTEQRQQILVKRLESIASEAKSIDGQEHPPRRGQTSRWLSRRKNSPGRTADGWTRFS